MTTPRDPQAQGRANLRLALALASLAATFLIAFVAKLVLSRY